MKRRADPAGESATAVSPRRSRRDCGATFIELLVSIVLLGTAGIALLVAVQTTLIGARKHDEIAQNQSLLAEVSDLITDTEPEQVTYVDCDSNPVAAYQTAIDTAFPPAGTITVSVAYWDRTIPGGGGFGTTCRYTNGDRLQRVTMLSTVDTVDREITVIKRPADVPTADTTPAPPIPPYGGGAGQAVVSPTPGING